MTTHDLARVGISMLGLYFLIGAIVEMRGRGPELEPIAAGLVLLVTDDWLATFLFGPPRVATEGSGDPETPS